MSFDPDPPGDTADPGHIPAGQNETPDWPPAGRDLDLLLAATSRLQRRLDAMTGADGLRGDLVDDDAARGRRNALSAIALDPAATRSGPAGGVGIATLAAARRRSRGRTAVSTIPCPVCDAVAIEGLRREIAALRVEIGRRRRAGRRRAAVAALRRRHAPIATTRPAPASAGDASPVPPAAPAIDPWVPATDAPASSSHDDARLARIEQMLMDLVAVHVARSANVDAAESSGTTADVETSGEPPPAEGASSGPTAAATTAAPDTPATVPDPPSPLPRPVPAPSITRLVAAARRARAAEAVTAKDSAPSDPAPAPAVAAPAVAAGRRRWTPRFVAAAASVAIAAGAYGTLREPLRAVVAPRLSAGWLIDGDPATTGSLPDALPFAVTAADRSGPAADFAAALVRLGKAEDDATAAELLLSAARAGIPQAAFRLAILYEHGTAVPQSRDEAIAWYRKAAERGHVAAMHNLAVLLLDGSRDEAVRWYRKAAGYGIVDSQFNLALLLAGGGPKEKAEAYRWFAIAAAAGDADAGRRRDALAAALPADARGDIDRQVAEWRPLPADPGANDDRLAAAGPAAGT